MEDQPSAERIEQSALTSYAFLRYRLWVHVGCLNNRMQPILLLGTLEEVYNLLWVRVGITLAMLAVLFLRARFPKVTVDGISIALIVIALTPWFVPMMNIKTIKLPGGTELEIQQQIKETRQELETDLGQLRQKVQVTTDMARFSMDAASRDGRPPRPDWDQRISELKKQYNLLRQQPSGRERTLEMTRIVGQLVPLMSQKSAYDVNASLNSSDASERLCAIAYIYARPSSWYLDALIRAAEREIQPFIQYWAIEAIGSILSLPGAQVLDAQKQSLQRLLEVVDAPNDHSRYTELKRILQNWLPSAHIETKTGLVTSDAKKVYRVLEQSRIVVPDYEKPRNFSATENTIYYNESDEQLSLQVTSVLKDAQLGSFGRIRDAKVPQGEIYVYIAG